MWYLTSDNDPRILYVTPNNEITIGRSVDAQVCNFAISDDASISRKHATLAVTENKLYLQDMGSRYGTFVNNMTEKVGDSKVKLNNNDIVRFGKINSVWKVHATSLVTCTSTLKGESLQNLKLCLSNLAGTFKSEWDDTCSYLTMPAITLTIKVVLALVQGSYIVTTEFWSKCVDAVKNQTSLPDPCKFTPHVVESTLNKENVSFFPNAERKSLFAGKTIIFFSRRQLDMYKTVLTQCSGTALLLSETQMSKSSLCEQNKIVIQYNLTNNTSQETQAQRNQINDIINYLKSKGKRIIADAEIGLAVLYCSTDKYCNPDFNFSTEVIKQTPAQNTKPGHVLAQESQEPTQKINNENVVINETLTPASSKRKLEDDDEAKANKKFASNVSHSPISNNESVKRKFSDDSNENLNPSKKMAVDNDDDIFNFQNNSHENGNGDKSEKLLNFIKPVQNKQNNGNDEDDLFNFVQDEEKNKEAGDTSNNTMFNKINYIKKEMDAESIQGKKRKLDDSVDISALRGSKLKELMENQANWSSDYKNVKVKKEDPDELDVKMNDLDLGTTIITVRKNLIVKKEPIQIEESGDQGGKPKNFKKFRKVWPVKMQVTVIPKSSMSIVIPDSLAEEITSQSY
ncbi:nibrin [Pectinophora gossypiella]|uniref:FHA domain-containing protein n=1 Tax=Pectinophora gossypiella TaxID=13191 RepID=A0A1E1W6Q8_PECGO|nr:nibrin [Pectinophora gossypiella]